MTAVAPLVDVTIAVHSASRPIRRAVASVLDGTEAPVRVIVVAHNIDPAIIRDNLGDLATDDRVLMLDLQDGIRSPAGPMNAGFANSTAPFIALLGSDDEFAPGALDSWLRVQRSTGASTVIPKIAPVTIDSRQRRRSSARPSTGPTMKMLVGFENVTMPSSTAPA